MKSVLLSLILFCAVIVKAQLNKTQFGFSITPGISNRILSQESNVAKPILLPESSDKAIVGFGGNLFALIPLSYSSNMQLGIQSFSGGFRRVYADVGFGDSIHPELPRIIDFFQGDPRFVVMEYRFHYLQIPILVDTELTQIRKAGKWNFFVQYGLIPGYAVTDKIIAKTRGFALDGQTRIKVSNPYPINRFNLQAFVGARAEFNLDDRFKLQLQPGIHVPLVSSLRGSTKAWVYQLALSVGLSIPLDKLSAE